MVDRLLVSLGLKYLAVKANGYKTYIAAGGKIMTGLTLFLTGVVGIIAYAFPDMGFPDLGLDKSLEALSAGSYAIFSGFQGVGQRHAIQKLQ